MLRSALFRVRRQQSTLASTAKRRPDPFQLLSPTLKELKANLLTLLGAGHPALTELAQYYFHHPSKHIRPLLVLLISQATNGLGRNWHTKLWESQYQAGSANDLDVPLSPPDVLTDWNPNLPQHTRRFDDAEPFMIRKERSYRKIYPHHTKPPPAPSSSSHPPCLHTPTLILPSQLRLAQIVEMLHTASLLHDDVIDASALRRGAPSAPSLFTNKLSVLGGNFVLGRASAALARLGEPEVTQLIASVLSNLVEGEILQMKDVVSAAVDTDRSRIRNRSEETESDMETKRSVEGQTAPSKYQDAWNIYLQKTYLKTASLMAKGARSAVVLGGCIEGEIWKEVAYSYGRNIGIAFQLVDDVLDYSSPSTTLGKPGNADLQLGLATAPALYAWEEHPEMGDLIGRKFANAGDVEKARSLVHSSNAIERTKTLARAYADEAKEVLLELPESEARDALEVLAERIVGRKF